MPPSQATFIADILEEHLEELDFLWSQRRNALRSLDRTLHELDELDHRIEAHVQGILVPGDDALQLLEAWLGDGSFAGAYPLLRLRRQEAADRVVKALGEARGPALEGIAEATCHGPLELIRKPIQELFQSGPPAVAAAVAAALAFHSLLAPEAERLAALFDDDEPLTRRAAWRAAGLVDSARVAGKPLPSRPFRAGWDDPDPRVRREALWAAAWSGDPSIEAHCRERARELSSERWDELYLLAVLGKPADLKLIESAGASAALGPRRFRVLAAFGHPSVVPTIITGIGDADPAVAYAAGRAFTKMTGADIESDERVQLPPEDGDEPDEFEREFLDEVVLPSPEQARAHWDEVKDSYGDSSRPCHNLEAWWEATLRAKRAGTWKGSLLDLEAVPRRRETEPGAAPR